MKTTFQHALTGRTPITLSALALACMASTPALAFNPQPDPPGRWAVMGLVADQTARLSVLAMPVARGVPPDPCTVTFNFLDADGNKLTEATSLVILPGKMRSVDLRGSDLRLANRTDRMQFRTEVHVLHNPPGLRQCEGATATVEIFDASGRTSVISNPSFLPPDPY